MKIQDCQMDISCQRSASETRESSYAYRAESGGEWQTFKDMLQSYAREGKDLPQEVRERAQAITQAPESWSSGAIASGEETRRRKVGLLLQEMITKLFAMLTAGDKGCRCGKDEDGTGLPDLGLGSGAAADASAEAPAARPRAPRFQVVAWESEASLKVRESESTTVCASGSVRTADGRCIDFNLEVAMQRRYEADYQRQESGIRVELTDPLVLNFPGKAAELADTRFDFDLDADGKRESVSGLSRGSAFLALDRNGDGIINDGRELFGALSGNGFADLKAYDTDGNNWIDEADAIYSQLRLWQPGAGADKAEAGGRLRTLQEAGVGALWLGSVQSEFSLKDGDNRQQGQVRQTGVWLAENGGAGSLQQVDLATT